MISLNNFQRILIKFGLWLGTGILICLVGISGVFADTYKATQFTVEGYDNYGPNLSRVTTDWTNNSWRWTIPSMVANSAGSAFIFNSPIPLISNHTYTLTAQIDNSWGTCLALSSFNRIGLGTTINSSKTSYENNTNVNENYSNSSACNIIQFAFTPTVNGTWLTIPFSTTSDTNIVTFTIYDLVIDDLGSKSLSQEEINNTLNNQTNILNANINAIGQDTSTIINQNNQLNNNINAVGQDTSTIINQNNNLLDNQNQNKQDIINNQNANTDKEIESQKVCSSYNVNYESVIIKNKYLTTSGVISGSNSSVGITDYYKISTNSKIALTKKTTNTNIALCFYNNKTLISCIEERTLSIDQDVTVPENANEVRFSINENTTGNFADSPNFIILACTNGNQALNDSITGLNDNLNNDDTSGATSEATDFFSSFNTNTFGLTSIVTAPLNLIQSLTSSTCSELHLPLPYLNNKYLDLPCMTSIYQTHFGAFFTMYQTITYGIIAYWVCVRIFNQVKDFKNPEHDEIEVVDL